jgi:hypothetical protein
MCEGRVSGCNKCYGCEGDGGSYESCMQLCVQSTCDPECSAQACETCIDGNCVMKCRTDLCYVCDGSGTCVFDCEAGQVCCGGVCITINDVIVPPLQDNPLNCNEGEPRCPTGCCPEPNWVCCKYPFFGALGCAPTPCDCPPPPL